MSKEQIKKEAESLMKEFRNILADDDCTICVNDDDELAILKWHVQSKIKLLEKLKGRYYGTNERLFDEPLNQQKEILILLYLKYLKEL